ncbi:MAG TPA: hypothetical protein DEB30_02610 [Candidatus Peribacter riflensis]|uniref:Sortase n=1 Tax=Candidatus Peribacter riflensis TaxID=1735162 RepID=A0A0S1SSF1_9BACT|nr:MAG: hypothetical protein PeribacterA2_0537 [Candidatus Peribacter riflensis]OGJ77068.1 MAG: hypothetical protein A2398_03005 [Candidatus Peribacteria bacterium RIFOXYB1_FULL_57_12]OGJ79081.1 MAG: hypothetical protein A2412_04730 [Candidatus Peribacteria bacterium RIFOXYC1_FULL_58_8]ALM11017.1 MAG: hypothetical protein PeribacterB2_0536 [Candidatus Peribacter riflensis]ALM12120.1 MAG: hypothetical protein PeribacterC2_0536 [Candidatus Peribacter riflensis]
MKQQQKRLYAFTFAAFALVAALLLWSMLLKNLTAQVTVEKAETPEASAVSSSPVGVEPLVPVGSALPEPPTIPAAAQEQRHAPLMPSLHFAASSTSSMDQRREELLQWEIQEAYSLSIPSLSIRSPVFLPSRRYWDAREWDALERQMQVGLLYGLVAYPHSVRPGTKGTMVIAGHSSPPTDRARQSRYGQIFAALPTLHIGGQIILRTATDTVTYVVTETKVVPSGDTSILLSERDDESLLTLITCYPIGSTKERFVVMAKRME